MKKFSSWELSLHSQSHRLASMMHNRCHRCNTVELCLLCSWVSQIYIWLTHLCQATSAAVNEWHCFWHDTDIWLLTSGSALRRLLWHLEGYVCMSVSGQNGVFVRHDAALTFDSTYTETDIHTHTLLFLMSCLWKHKSYLHFIYLPAFQVSSRA